MKEIAEGFYFHKWNGQLLYLERLFPEKQRCIDKDGLSLRGSAFS